MEILRKKKAELLVKSPADGVVVTWDLKTRLFSRPVQRGSVLMRIADPKKEWQLELHMPEQNMGFVEEAQQKLHANQRQELRRLLLEQKRSDNPNHAEKMPASPLEAAGAANAPAPKEENGPALSAEAAASPAAEPANAAPGESANAVPVESTAAPPADDPLAAEVDAEVDAIPDELLYERWSQLAKTKLDAQLKDILKDLPAGDAKDQLDGILRQPSYKQAWDALSTCIASLPDEEVLKAKLSAIAPAHFLAEDNNVTFILATDPGRHFYGRIKEIHKSAEVRGDEGNTVLIKVAIDKSQFQDLLSGVITPGAEVTAKVHCGRSSLGYKWLHQVYSFIQTKIIFRYF